MNKVNKMSMGLKIASRQSLMVILKFKIVPADPEPEGEGDEIHVWSVQKRYKLKYWVTTIWGWVKFLFWHH